MTTDTEAELTKRLDAASVECRRLRTALGEIRNCHRTGGQSTHLCPKCERLVDAGCRGLLADI